MRVLVTGATGFVGGHVARHLQTQGYQVLATGRNLIKGRALGLPFQPAELDDPEQAARIGQGQDAVIHCAAFPSPWGEVAEFHRHNVLTTQHLLQAKIPRFVFISSAGVCFQQDDRLDVTEADPLPEGEQHPYLASKRLAEEVVQQTSGWVILRPRAIYGPGDQAILPRIIRLLRHGLLPIIGDGKNLASLTYVENLALACESALHGPTENIFHITDGQAVPLWPLLAKVAENLDFPAFRWRLSQSKAMFLARLMERFYQRFCPQREPPLTPYVLSLLTCEQTMSVEKARQLLNYSPVKDTWQGIVDTLESERRVERGDE